MSETVQILSTQPQSEDADRFLNYSFHELRTPLTVIYSCAQLAFDKLPAGTDFDRLRRIMRQMLDQSEEMVEMLEEFLEASRLQAGKIELDATEIEMRELCQQTLAHLSEAQQQRVELELPAEEKHLILQADGTRLEAIIFTLLDLGLKSTPPTTHIKLALDNWSAGMFVISVVMPGLIISEAEQNQMFEANFIPDNTYSKLKAGKSGVGLYIARGIMQAHGGTLEYDPTQTTFQIKLPNEQPTPTSP